MHANHGRGSLWCGRLARNLALKYLMFASVISALLFGGAVSAADDVILRSSVNPETAWVGQRTLLNLEVLGADGWAQITDMGELEILGAYVMRTESQGLRLSETIGRTSYTGQRYQLSVYCQRPGRLEIPGLPVTVTVKQWGATPPETHHEAVTPATALICKIPPEAEGIRGLISTNRLEADQQWSSERTTVDLGDAVTRTVSLSADDVSGMAFPPAQYPEIDGVGIYPGQPSVADETNRGSLRGQREESVTYVFEEPGAVELPDVVVNWWNPESGRLERVVLTGLELEVVGEPAPAVTDLEPEVETFAEPPGLFRTALLAIPILGFAIWLGGWLWRRSLKWRAARRVSEPAYFRRVRAAIRGGNPMAIIAAIMAWLDRLNLGIQPARLDLFLQDHGDESARTSVATLEECLTNGDDFVDRRLLLRGLKNARHTFLQTQTTARKTRDVLPELNGSGPR